MTIKEIEEALEEGQSLKTIAQAYSEIANLKIKIIRGLVERNRFFFSEISKVYSLIKKLAQKRKVAVPKSKKLVSIIITSNFRFYGSINEDLIDFFIQTTTRPSYGGKKLDTDIIFLGKAAIDYFKTNKIFLNYREIMLKDDQPSAEELTSLVSLIQPYNQVLIFHSKLKSLLTQQPVITDITASSTPPPSEKISDDSFKFIFEPELGKILSFFDSQILTLLLESTFLESELSRTAPRFIRMDEAQREANKFIDEYQKLKAFSERSFRNNQILENFATIVAARKGQI